MGDVIPMQRRRGGLVLEGGKSWVRTRGIAEHFDVSEDTIGRWVKKGMPSVKYHRARFFDVSACDAWLERRSA